MPAPVNFRVRITGLDDVQGAMIELGPAYARRMIGPALNAMARVVRKYAARKNFIFKEGRGVRPYDRARGLDESRRLRSTLRTKQIAGTFAGRRIVRLRSLVLAGGTGARHAFLVHDGGRTNRRPYPFLTEALFRSSAQSYNAFIAKARERHDRAVLAARRKARGSTIAARSRRVALQRS